MKTNLIGLIQEFFLPKRDEKLTEITQQLTQEQRKLYRNQYIKLATKLFIATTIYLGAIINVINKTFQGIEVFYNLAILGILIKFIINQIEDTGEETSLILERIEKRAKKNIRKQKKGDK